jgi:hypothetical protein
VRAEDQGEADEHEQEQPGDHHREHETLHLVDRPRPPRLVSQGSGFPRRPGAAPAAPGLPLSAASSECKNSIAR